MDRDQDLNRPLPPFKWRLLVAGLAVAALYVGTVIVAPRLRQEATCRQSDYWAQRHELSALKLTSAAHDADSAWSRGDRRLLSVIGYSEELPGVDESDAQRRGLKWRVLVGTSDVWRCEGQSDVQAAVTAYASKYNAAVLKLASSATR